MSNNRRSFTVSSPGRICLAGEDIDWMSGPSVLCAINIRTKVHIGPNTGNFDQIEIISEGAINGRLCVPLLELSSYKSHPLNYCQAAVKVIADLGANIEPIIISVTSDLPGSAGLSSSAAVIVATLGAMNAYFNLQLTPTKLCELGYAVESEELKTGAGQMDFYPCALGGIIYLNSFSEPPSPIITYKTPIDCALVIIDTLSPRSTKDVIAAKRERYASNEEKILQYKQFTEDAIDELKAELSTSFSIDNIGHIITRCHTYLDKYMNVSTALLNSCVNICLEAGAYGAKLTGTGMGGCMFAFTPRTTLRSIRKAAEELPVRMYETTIAEKGIEYS